MTPDQAVVIEAMRAKGKSYAAISRKIGKSASSVRWYCDIYGVKSPKPKLKAKPRSCDMTEAQITLMKEMLSKGAPYAVIGRALGRSHTTIIRRASIMAAE